MLLLLSSCISNARAQSRGRQNPAIRAAADRRSSSIFLRRHARVSCAFVVQAENGKRQRARNRNTRFPTRQLAGSCDGGASRRANLHGPLINGAALKLSLADAGTLYARDPSLSAGYSEDSDYTSDLNYPVGGQGANSSASQFRTAANQLATPQRSLETSRENSYERDDHQVSMGKQFLLSASLLSYSRDCVEGRSKKCRDDRTEDF